MHDAAGSADRSGSRGTLASETSPLAGRLSHVDAARADAQVDAGGSAARDCPIEDVAGTIDETGRSSSSGMGEPCAGKTVGAEDMQLRNREADGAGIADPDAG